MTTRINIYPRATEKAYGQSKNNVYVFDAPMTANKQQILAAVEEQYSVKAISIKTLVQDGKAVRASRGKNARPGVAYRKDSKKAYITLAQGNSIKVFDEAVEPAPTAKDDKKARTTKLKAKEEVK